MKINGLRIVSKLLSLKKYQLILKFITIKRYYKSIPSIKDLKFYWVCKAGARTINPCAHSLCVFRLIKSIIEQLHLLEIKDDFENYHDKINIGESSSYYQNVSNNII